MLFALLAAIAIAGTLVGTRRGRRVFAQLRVRKLLMPGLVATLGAIFFVKGAVLLGSGIALGALVWAGRINQAKPLPPEKSHDTQALRSARALLGVPAGADVEAINAAHRRLIALHHPDVGGGVDLAKNINAARDLLIDQAKS